MLPPFCMLLAARVPDWQTLAPGMDLRYLKPQGSRGGDSAITVLRMDPQHWELALLGTSQTGEAAGHTARER